MLMNGNLKYVIGAILFIVLAVVGACTVVFVVGNPTTERTASFIAIVTAVVSPTLVALLALLKAHAADQKSDDTVRILTGEPPKEH
jgi:hypothetical protein